MSPIVANASEPLPVYSQPDTIAIPSPGAPVSVYILPTEVIERILTFSDPRDVSVRAPLCVWTDDAHAIDHARLRH